MAYLDFLSGVAKGTIGALPTVAITYRLFVAQSFVPATGVKTSTYHDVLMRVKRADVTVDDITPGGAGPVQLGDVKYTIPSVNLSKFLTEARADDVTTSDRIVEGTGTYRVVAVNRPGSGALVTVVARREN